MPVRGPLKIFISYAHEDQRLLGSLSKHLFQLEREGLIHPWHDRCLQAGQDWAGQIDRNLESADIILLLVSASFLASRYCNDIEMKRALERHERDEARVIPVILRPSDWSGSEFARLQALPEGAKAVTEWSNRDRAYLSIAAGIREVAEEMAAPLASKPQKHPPRADAIRGGEPSSVRSCGMEPVASLEVPEGPVRLDSPFYLHPAQELRCYEEIGKPGALIRLKSPKGFGKSSLMARIVAHASSIGARTATLDLLSGNRVNFETPTRFLQWFCAVAGKQLGVRVRTEDYWDEIFGANDNATEYFETYLLQPDSTPLVLAIDNFDRLFAHAAIEADVFGLLRSWHEQSRSKPLWERFRLIIAHSQEPYLQKDINQSPFNVGLPVELGELSSDQVCQLAATHGLDLTGRALEELCDLVGGHPQLVRKALYSLARGLAFSEFLRSASTEAGIYSDHLRGLLKAVEEAGLSEALASMTASESPVMLPTEQAFKLDSLGLVMPVDNQVKLRCRLYRAYFRDRLGS